APAEGGGRGPAPRGRRTSRQASANVATRIGPHGPQTRPAPRRDHGPGRTREVPAVLVAVLARHRVDPADRPTPGEGRSRAAGRSLARTSLRGRTTPRGG